MKDEGCRSTHMSLAKRGACAINTDMLCIKPLLLWTAAIGAWRCTQKMLTDLWNRRCKLHPGAR